MHDEDMVKSKISPSQFFKEFLQTVKIVIKRHKGIKRKIMVSQAKKN